MRAQVCELDLIFNFQKAYAVLDELIIAGEIQESSKKTVLKIVRLYLIFLLWEANMTMADGVMAISGRLHNLMLLKKVSRCARAWSKAVWHFEMQSHRKGRKVVSPLLLPDVLERLNGKAEDKMGLNGVQRYRRWQNLLLVRHHFCSWSSWRLIGTIG